MPVTAPQPANPGSDSVRAQIAEEWRPVVGYEGLYEVSDQGRVRSLHGNPDDPRTLALHPNHRGYLTVVLSRDGVRRTQRVHLLVATTWHGPRDDGQVCRHLDGDQLNNRPNNLRWGTQAENMADSVRHGTQAQARKTHCANGHRFDELNTLPGLSRPGRACRQCARDKRRSKVQCPTCGKVLSRGNLRPHRRNMHGEPPQVVQRRPAAAGVSR